MTKEDQGKGLSGTTGNIDSDSKHCGFHWLKASVIRGSILHYTTLHYTTKSSVRKTSRTGSNKPPPPPPPPPNNKKLHTGWSDIRIPTEGALSRLTEAASLWHGFIAQYMSPVKHTTPKRNEQADDVSWPHVTEGTGLVWALLSVLTGIVMWSFLEYSLHRWVFHLQPPATSSVLITFHFLMHGLHHKVQDLSYITSRSVTILYEVIKQMPFVETTPTVSVSCYL